MEIDIKLIQPEWLDLDQIELNDGQLEGIPANPRTITPEDYELLKKSIIESPKMMGLKEMYVKRHGDGYVVCDGNMRLKALRELGYKQAICKVIPEHFTAEEVMAVIIKTNTTFGDWDQSMLKEDWDTDKLKDWGVDILPDSFDGDIDSLFQDAANSGGKEKHFEIRLQFAEDMETEADIIKAKIKEALSEYPYLVK